MLQKHKLKHADTSHVVTSRSYLCNYLPDDKLKVSRTIFHGDILLDVVLNNVIISVGKTHADTYYECEAR